MKFKSKRPVVFSLLLAASSFCFSHSIQAQENSVNKSQVADRAEEIFRTNNNITIIQLEALKEFNQQGTVIKLLDYKLAQDPKNHELWAYLGLNQLQQSNYAKSIEAYKKAVENSKSPQQDIYLYNLAEVENLAGNSKNAETYLKQIPEDSIYKSSANQALKNLKSGQKFSELKANAPGNFKTNLGVKVGYDDNVLLFSESTLATAQRTDTASLFVTPELTLSYSKPVSYGLFNSSLNLNTQQYGNPNAKIYQSFAGVLSAGISGQQPAWASLVHSVTNTFKTSYLDSNSFNQQSWDNTVQWRGVKNLSPSDSFNFGFLVRYQKYIEGVGRDNRTGLAYKPEVTMNSAIGEYNGSVGISYERLQAEGDNYKSDAFSLPLSLDKKLDDSLSGNLGLTYTYTNYPNSTAGRKDGTVNINTGLNKQFSKAFSSGVAYSYTKNASSENTGTYTRQTLELKVNYEID